MQSLIVLTIMALTMPIWGGALAAAVGTGFFLLVQHPIIFIAVIALLFMMLR